MGNPWQSYGASLAIRDHTVLSATRHKWRHPTLTPANQASTRFTYPGGMEGWVDLGSPIAAWPAIEHTTARWQVRRPIPLHYTEQPADLSLYYFMVHVLYFKLYNLCITYLLPLFLAGEPVDFTKDSTGVFEPTHEWKTVEPGMLCWIFATFWWIVNS